ncbi:peptidase C1 [candidate division KSB1 bacterium]|nr:peptidase C1 [candidate division KSB1 bacterium]
MLYVSMVVISSLIQVSFAQSPQKDKGKFVERKNEFWDKIKNDSEKFRQGKTKTFILDFENKDLPQSKEEFTTYWHQEPISQGNSGMCWCYCTTSFYESEIYRTTGRKIKLSELYTVYWEYVEKARRYVEKMGDSHFAEGSMGNHIPIIWEKYGVVPAEAYTGLDTDQPFHDHSEMFDEMKSYLDHVKENWLWDQETVLTTIKMILNKHIGEPPQVITVDGKEMTPVEYFNTVIDIDFDEYIDLLSLLEKPYDEFVVYPVPDNWWKSDRYYNVPLESFMRVLKHALRNGYTVGIGGDVSEAGYYSYKEVAMVPSFDIPSDYIDEHARQFRFSNKSTTDDHGVHVVGFMEKDGEDWYLIKDSGSGSRNGPNPGYYFYHQDYIKLKMMDFVVHKDAVKGILEF